MAQFTYIDTQTRTYPDICVSGAVLVAESGKVYDLDADPGDGRWSSSVKVATSAPAVASADPSLGTALGSDADDGSAVTPTESES